MLRELAPGAGHVSEPKVSVGEAPAGVHARAQLVGSRVLSECRLVRSGPCMRIGGKQPQGAAGRVSRDEIIEQPRRIVRTSRIEAGSRRPQLAVILGGKERLRG